MRCVCILCGNVGVCFCVLLTEPFFIRISSYRFQCFNFILFFKKREKTKKERKNKINTADSGKWNCFGLTANNERMCSCSCSNISLRCMFLFHINEIAILPHCCLYFYALIISPKEDPSLCLSLSLYISLSSVCACLIQINAFKRDNIHGYL